MISNASAAPPAQWWQLILMAVVLIGVFMFVLGEIIHFAAWLCRSVAMMFKPSTYQTIYVHAVTAQRADDESRDPTRPRAWDDVEGKVMVAERMRHLDSGKHKR